MTITNDQPLEQTTGLDAAAKRQKNIGHADFGTSAARQAAALVWAGAEVSAELRESSAVTAGIGDTLTALATAATRQADAAERSAAAAERTATLTHVQSLLAFYNTPEQLLPDGVRDQFKALLGIRAGASTPTPAAPPQVPAASQVKPASAPFDAEEF